MEDERIHLADITDPYDIFRARCHINLRPIGGPWRRYTYESERVTCKSCRLLLIADVMNRLILELGGN